VAAIRKRHRLAGDDVLQRAALLAREHGRVDLLRILLLAEDHAAAAVARRFVLWIVVVTTSASG